MPSANFFIGDELANKNYYLTKALVEANQIIQTLEQENTRIKDVLTNLASLKNTDLNATIEAHNDKLCTV
jgi:DNA integrity scanning protein DisA with diadenylate cyclase activity